MSGWTPPVSYPEAAAQCSWGPGEEVDLCPQMQWALEPSIDSDQTRKGFGLLRVTNLNDDAWPKMLKGISFKAGRPHPALPGRGNCGLMLNFCPFCGVDFRPWLDNKIKVLAEVAP